MRSPEVRVRMAPSPTGLLHVGNVRTAIFNWLLARHHGGSFILRIEDTDRNRLVPGSVDSIQQTLRWMGLDWDEGPGVGGEYGPYIQSERKEIYGRYAAQLLAEGKAYRCYCTEERLTALRSEQAARGEPTRYDRHCRYLSGQEREALEASGASSVVRFATPLEGTIGFSDALRGPLTYDLSAETDFIILKSDGFPPYHFAVVVDDHLMRISHVIRGDEYISSTWQDLLLFDALGWSTPTFVHTSQILAPDRSRLSKRHGATAVLEFRELGFLPEALFNYLALLGASYSAVQEVFSRGELIRLFDVDKLHPTPGIFDRTKLEWMNQHYINRVLSLDDVSDRCRPYLRDAGLVTDETPGQYVRAVVDLVKDRIRLLPEVVELTEFFFREPSPQPLDLMGKKLSPAEAGETLEKALQRLQSLPEWSEEAMEQQMRTLAEELGLKAGVLFMLLRVALTGRTVSPGLFETMRVLGRETSLRRLGSAGSVLAAA